MNIKALPSMGQRLFCCFCFVESAVCSTFAERIIRGCLQGVHLSQVHQQSKKYTGKATLVHLRQVHPLRGTNKARSAPPKGTP